MYNHNHEQTLTNMVLNNLEKKLDLGDKLTVASDFVRTIIALVVPMKMYT